MDDDGNRSRGMAELKVNVDCVCEKKEIWDQGREQAPHISPL